MPAKVHPPLANERRQRCQIRLPTADRDHGTSTIYMWGFPRGTDDLVRYVHRSKLDYAPERGSGQAFGHKPRAETFEPDLPETPAQVIKLASRLKQENDDALSSEPVAIGGDLIATRLTPTSIEHQRWYRFPDSTRLRRCGGSDV